LRLLPREVLVRLDQVRRVARLVQKRLDLVLVQADVAEEALPWLMEKYGSRLRETTLDEMAAKVVARRR
jgi:hypothetical protein